MSDNTMNDCKNVMETIKATKKFSIFFFVLQNCNKNFYKIFLNNNILMYYKLSQAFLSVTFLSNFNSVV